MLFRSRTAQVAIRQGDADVTGSKNAGDFNEYTVGVRSGPVVIEFTNLTANATDVTLNAGSPVRVSPGASMPLPFAVSGDTTCIIRWFPGDGMRVATVYFKA